MRLLLVVLSLSLAGPALAGKVERAEKLALKANEAREDGKRSRAVKLAERALKKDPTNTTALFVRANENLHILQEFMDIAVRARESGDTEAASSANLIVQILGNDVLSDFQAIVELDPGSVEAGISRQLIAALTGKADRVSMSLPRAECPADAVAAHDKAEEAFSARDMVAASEHYATALGQCDSAATWWVHYGDAAHALGKSDLALERYGEALEREPCHWQAHRFMGDVMMRAGKDPNAAMGHFILAVTCNPTYEPAWSNLGPLGGRGFGPIRRSDDAEGHAAVEEALEGAAGGSALARHRAAVTGVLDAGAPETPLWAELATAREADQLDAAIFVHLMDEGLIVEYTGWVHPRIEAASSYLMAYAARSRVARGLPPLPE